ncbi:16S rRNA (uracil(1498)-N(3))-methyltransferase [Glaciecola petra]|uniref:Ribosomal RNA small subunit methyltransferase E n=1 Tax=Glaciecola petra TaxID=3075602 RepID=A0ABU2ZLG2_9ALTE|nr:16S rRNA (uracil(1498)-N(3))-methyltransferase [Aestuariibacter sp. P117]MDT0593462.1 16S rRNA (uracil(1498)-N(3))-methyltransferase [Aestuariibacter sp. P117]
MRISRFYIDSSLSVDTEVTLPIELVHYINNVLRLKENTPIVLFNGDGNEYPADLTVIGKRRAEAIVTSQIGISTESPLYLHLAQGISKGERMEIALQKAVEIGVSEITPVITELCNVKLTESRWEKKHQSWRKLVISACEQCHRNVIPKINKPLPLHTWFGLATDLQKLILVPGASTYLSGLTKPQNGFKLLVGPEGGFTKQEVYTAQELGFKAVNLGPRVLRTETAAAASLAILQAQHGDM